MDFFKAFLKNMLEFFKAFLKNMLETEAARFIAYGSSLVIVGAIYVASKFSVTLPPEVLAAFGVIGAGLVAEVIRYFVYSAKTFDAK